MGEHRMFMPDVHVACRCGGQEREFHLGDSKLLLSGLSPPLWPTALDDPFLASLLAAPPLSQRVSQVYLSPSSWSPSSCLSMGVRDKGVVYHCGYITNPQGISSAVEYLKETAWLRSLPELCGQEYNMHWRKLFYFLFISSLLPGLDQGLGESGQQQAKSWPDPCLFCSGFMGLHRRMHRPLCLQDTVIFSTQHRWHPLQYYQLTFDYYNFP